MLFPARVLERIVAGDITLAFRRWERPHARPGARHRTRLGVIAIESVERVPRRSITAADARRAGHAGRAELLALLDRRGDAPIWRIELRYAGEDPRIALREQAELKEEELAGLQRKLERLGPWTLPMLRQIADQPGVRAQDLADQVGREKLPFKRDVRKLKELGLTESLERGYRLSPRGRVVLERLG